MRRVARLIHSEEAQATTEYILLLSTVVVLATLVIQKLLRPLAARAGVVLGKKVEKALGGPNFHNFPVNRR